MKINLCSYTSLVNIRNACVKLKKTLLKEAQTVLSVDPPDTHLVKLDI